MILQQFNGGLNIREAAELIKSNEAIICSNVDIHSNQLSSAKGLGSKEASPGFAPFYWAAKDQYLDKADSRDYLAYQEKLYWSDGNIAKKYDGATTHDLGIEQPTTISVANYQVPTPGFTPVVKKFTGSINATVDYGVGGNLRTNTDYTWYMAVTIAGKVVYVASKAFHIPSHTDADDNELNDATVYLDSDFIAPTGVSWSVEFGRLYNGTVRHTGVTDSVYDISGNSVVPTSKDSSCLEGSSIYHLGLAFEEDGILGPQDRRTIEFTESFGYIEIQFSEAVTSYNGDYRAQRIYSNELQVTNAVLTKYLFFKPETNSTKYLPGGLNGTIQYLYTYYNEADGTESQPSPLSVEQDVDSGKCFVTVSPSSDPQVTHIFIYRIGGQYTKFVKIAEVTNTATTYTDKVSDRDLVVLKMLDSELNGKAPQGLKYLSQAHGVFFGVVKDKLYFTRDIGNPNYWPEAYYIDFDQPITGLATISAGLAVFTKYQTYLVTGTNSQTFVKYLVSSDQGCTNAKSIVAKQGTALFTSTDGICLINGSNVSVLSKFKLGKQNYESICATLHDEVYYLLLKDKTILAFDTRYAPAFLTFDFQLDWLHTAKDTLYGSKGSDIYPMFSGDLVQYHYSTGNLTEGSLSMLKHYNTIYAYVTGKHTLKVYINNELVATRELEESTKPLELTVPQQYQMGSSIRFELTGVGIVKELEYKVMGRQNGK